VELKEFIEAHNYTFPVKVSPKASSNRIKLEKKSDNTVILKIFVTTVPEDGKANEAVIKLLAKELKIAKSSIKILHGITDKNKVVEIECLKP
jgi:uncharacterized protein